MDMDLEKCKDCFHCVIFREENENGEYITLYCPNSNDECPSLIND